MEIVKNQTIKDKKVKAEKQTKQKALFSLVFSAVLENIKQQRNNSKLK